MTRPLPHEIREQFCARIEEWAIFMSAADLNFGEAWREVHLAIRKSCLLSRTLYAGERPSQTPCPVHKGKWSGIYVGQPGQFWIDAKGNRTPVSVGPHLRAEYDAGCRCYLHKCGCTTGWQPDEHCGCVTPKESE